MRLDVSRGVDIEGVSGSPQQRRRRRRRQSLPAGTSDTERPSTRRSSIAQPVRVSNIVVPFSSRPCRASSTKSQRTSSPRFQTGGSADHRNNLFEAVSVEFVVGALKIRECIFHRGIFDRIAFSTSAFSVAPS